GGWGGRLCFTVSPARVEPAGPGGPAGGASPAATTRPVSAFAARRAGKECIAGSPSVILEADDGRTDPRGATRTPGPSSPDGPSLAARVRHAVVPTCAPAWGIGCHLRRP